MSNNYFYYPSILTTACKSEDLNTFSFSLTLSNNKPFRAHQYLLVSQFYYARALLRSRYMQEPKSNNFVFGKFFSLAWYNILAVFFVRPVAILLSDLCARCNKSEKGNIWQFARKDQSGCCGIADRVSLVCSKLCVNFRWESHQRKQAHAKYG